jgi:archaeal type IV pilus assembly protein PilA
MKLLKSRKALSPVVASIILIAVTVAVSIAVAAWMGALTFTFTNTEQIQITSMTFGTNWIALIANNTGTTPVTINAVYLNNAATPITTFAAGQSPGNIAANAGAVINMTTTVTNGYNYQVKLVSAKGNSFLYSAVAPSS